MFDDIGVGITFVIKNLAETKSGISDIDSSLKKMEKAEISTPLKKASKSTNDVNKGLQNAVTNAKKFGFALLTVRGVWFAIRKAMTSYLAENEELQSKLNGVYYALGSLFSPMLETLVSWLTTIIAYVDVLVRSLGLAGMNMTNFGKSAKAAKNAVAGFDEINNINKSSGDTSTNPFANVSLNPETVSTLQQIGKLFKPVVDFLSKLELSDIIGAVVLINLFELISGLQSVKALLEGINKIKLEGILLVIVGFYTAVSSFLEMWKNGYNDVSEGLMLIGIAITAIGAIILGAPAVVATIVAGIVALVSTLVILVKDNWDDIKSLFDASIADLKEKWNAFWSNLANKLKETLNKLKENWNTFWSSLKIIGRAFIDAIKQDVEFWKNAIGTAVTNIKDGVISKFNQIKTGVSNIWNAIWTTIRGILNKIIGGIEHMVNRCIDGLNSLLSPLRMIANGILDAVGIKSFSFSGISHVSLPRLASGTNYVPNDMVAEIHQGEAVIPKQFNSQEFFGDNTETNNLLRQLIDVVDTKEFKAYISQKEVGKAATNYINSQSRIMGGSLV